MEKEKCQYRFHDKKKGNYNLMFDSDLGLVSCKFCRELISYKIEQNRAAMNSKRGFKGNKWLLRKLN
jgi:hypothetical protein